MLLVNSSLFLKNKEKIGGKPKTSIKRKFLIFTVSLFLVILAGGGIAFFINMDNIVRTDVVQKLSRLIEFKASKLESSTAKEIAIALKMADSPIIREYFLSPGNAELERLAFMEIAGYRRAFTGNNVFWINDTDHNYYFGDEFSYTLDPADPSSNWYSSIIKNPGPYFFNVDTDIGTKKTMLWINAPVMQGNRAIGIVGTGIDLTGFIDAIFSDASEDIPFYLFNSGNMITGAADWNLTASRQTLSQYFGSLGNTIADNAKETKDELRAFMVDNTEYVISYIPSLDWHIVAMSPLNMGMVFTSAMAFLFYIILSVVLIIFVIINIFIFRMLKPLDEAVGQLGEIAETWDLTRRFKVTGTDETGRLAEILNLTFRRIQELVTIINSRARSLAETETELAQQMNTTAASVTQIATVTQNIRGQTDSQAGQVGRVDTSMANIIALVEKLNGHIRTQSENVSQSSSAIEQMFANISMVAANLEKNSENVHALEESSGISRKELETVSAEFKDITQQAEGLLEINSVINNIASQTNLLSMNAAIEAAHAGDTGKGFAVVAGEIRKLAENSSSQSKSIADMVKKMKGAIDTITKSIDRVLNRFEDIDGKVRTISEQETEIRGAMEEQETGSKQILEAITQLKNLTGTVLTDAGAIVVEGNAVIDESRNLKGITSGIERGMHEMAAGAQHIKTAVNRVNEISNENKNSTDILIGEVLKFKVS
jgi:methyl-accepting chemotaxis protein